jgi:hypothetical protein
LAVLKKCTSERRPPHWTKMMMNKPERTHGIMLMLNQHGSDYTHVQKVLAFPDTRDMESMQN